MRLELIVFQSAALGLGRSHRRRGRIGVSPGGDRPRSGRALRLLILPDLCLLIDPRRVENADALAPDLLGPVDVVLVLHETGLMFDEPADEIARATEIVLVA